MFHWMYFLAAQVFEPFGAVELVQLPHDEGGHCKGFGFVQVSFVSNKNEFEKNN